MVPERKLDGDLRTEICMVRAMCGVERKGALF